MFYNSPLYCSSIECYNDNDNDNGDDDDGNDDDETTDINVGPV